MKQKQCAKCGEMKPTEEFYKNGRAKDGLYSYCKSCHHGYLKAYRLRHKEAFRQYRTTYRLGHREALRQRKKAYCVANREQVNKYAASPAGHAAAKRSREKHKVATAAAGRANRALRSGALVRSTCELCGSTNSDMHHHDYSRPLDVNWLCRDCHGFITRCLRRIAEPLAELQLI